MAQSTLHAWVRGVTKPSAAGMDKIARITGLPAEYWLDPAVPYPPPLDYMGAVENLEAAIRKMGVDEMRAWVHILSHPDHRRRALLLWEAAEQGRRTSPR